jgi:hypothetical protein
LKAPSLVNYCLNEAATRGGEAAFALPAKAVDEEPGFALAIGLLKFTQNRLKLAPAAQRIRKGRPTGTSCFWRFRNAL